MPATPKRRYTLTLTDAQTGETLQEFTLRFGPAPKDAPADEEFVHDINSRKSRSIIMTDISIAMEEAEEEADERAGGH